MRRINRRTAIRCLSTFALFGILTGLAGPAIADGKVFTSWGKAIRGYDPVAYFTQHKPLEGSADFTHEWMGAEWRFANAANRDAFAKNPTKYAPQYGGYCAWAVSQGYTASTDPEAWRIVNDKLYLNYSKSVQQQWIDGGIPKLIKQGDKNWPGLRKGLGG
jgi:YHS domain-containing protein